MVGVYDTASQRSSWIRIGVNCTNVTASCQKFESVPEGPLRKNHVAGPSPARMIAISGKQSGVQNKCHANYAGKGKRDVCDDCNRRSARIMPMA